MRYNRCGAQRARAAGRLDRPLAQLRPRPAARHGPRDPAPRVRPRHHALRPRQQLRPAVRLGRGELRPALLATTSRPTATSSSSRRRPATTCGPARTATGARASTCSRASTRACGRMGLDYVDIFYSHRFDPDTPLEETMGALDTAVRQGKALYVGISSYSPEKTREAAAILRELGTPLLIHQPSYSMLNRWIEDGLLDALGELGVGCICFSPLAQGMLTDKYLNGIPRGLPRQRENSSLSPDLLTDETLREDPRAERDRRPARPVARPDGGGLGAARPAGHLGADRGVAASRSSRRTSPRSTSSTSPPRSSRRSTATRPTARSTSGPARARSSVCSPQPAAGSAVTVRAPLTEQVPVIASGCRDSRRGRPYGRGRDRPRCRPRFDPGADDLDEARFYGVGMRSVIAAIALTPFVSGTPKPKRPR